MLTQPLLDKLSQLNLTGFRQALETQLASPQYAELSFEERLGLLLDVEVTRRTNNRLKRRIRAAQFSLPATMADLDLSPRRVSSGPMCCNWPRVNGWDAISTSSSWARPGRGKVSWLVRWGGRLARRNSPSAMSAPLVCSSDWSWLGPMAPMPRPFPNWRERLCSSWMIGSETPCLGPRPGTCWKSWMTAMGAAPLCWLPRCPSLTGMPVCPTPPWPMRSSTGLSTTLTGLNYKENR